MNYLEAAAPYLSVIHAAEDKHGLPENLLVRIGWQESSYRLPVIDGTIKSPAGAVGMFQLMPNDFPGAGESWEADAETAAKLLASLEVTFKDWSLVIAAYNDGQGNIGKFLSGKRELPDETINYVNDVIGDLPLQGMLA